MATEFLSMKEAQEHLGASRMKMWRLVQDGILTTFSDPLDRRKRLVRKDDIEKLRQPKVIAKKKSHR